jgi:hypothetical protein
VGRFGCCGLGGVFSLYADECCSLSFWFSSSSGVPLCYLPVCLQVSVFLLLVWAAGDLDDVVGRLPLVHMSALVAGAEVAMARKHFFSFFSFLFSFSNIFFWEYPSGAGSQLPPSSKEPWGLSASEIDHPHREPGFDSFRFSMEKGGNRMNSDRVPLCGKLQYTTAKQEPVSLSFSLSLVLSLWSLWG